MSPLRSALLAVSAVAVVVLGGCGGSAISPNVSTPLMGTLAVGEPDFTAPEENPNNPVRAAAATNLSPCVLFARGQFMMWTNGSGDTVFLSVSTDGISWGPPQPCVGLNTRAVRPRVIYDASNDRFELWAWNGANEYNFGAVYHAISTDGLSWQDIRSCAAYGSPHRPVYTLYGNSVGIFGPCQVLFNEGASLSAPDYANPMANRYVMFYHLLRQADGKRVVGLAVSSDGITWGAPVERTGVLEVGPAGAWDSGQATDCTVIEHGGVYHMYYGGGVSSARQGIGYASSTDELNWSKAAAPIYVPDPAVPWRSSQVGAPSACVDGREMKLYMVGTDSAVGLATVQLQSDPDPNPIPDPQPTPDPQPNPDPKPLPSGDVTPPFIKLCRPSPTVLWPARGARLPVLVKGTAKDAESGLAVARLAVKDEYGQENQVMDLLPKLKRDGSFCVLLKLRASRWPRDRDGRQYLIVLSAADRAGNEAKPVVAKVVCPQKRKPDSDRP